MQEANAYGLQMFCEDLEEAQGTARRPRKALNANAHTRAVSLSHFKKNNFASRTSYTYPDGEAVVHGVFSLFYSFLGFMWIL